MGNLKNQIEELLVSTGREGIAGLCVKMDEMGFYDAPCSTQYHLAKNGGLAEHSLNVCILAEKLAELLYPELDKGTIRIVSLLHDLGKAGQFGKPNYVENVLKSGKKAAKPFVTNSELMYVDHEVRSIQITEKYINLTEEENWAILMHNGMYGTFKYQIQGKETPLYLILYMADMWASRVTEKEGADDGEA